MAKMQIKRVGVLSYAKITAVVMAGVSLVIAIPVGLIMMVVGAAAMSQSGGGGAAGLGIGLGLFYMIGLPIIYGVMGFVFGAIGSLIYNVASGFVGGIEIDVENAEIEYSAPPPPQWGATAYNPGQQQSPY